MWGGRFWKNHPPKGDGVVKVHGYGHVSFLWRDEIRVVDFMRHGLMKGGKHGCFEASV
jgi:hypothetical protein